MASLRLDIDPAVIRWALQRSGRAVEDLSEALESRVEAWLRGEKKPTYKQLEDFSRAVHVPFGYLFLPAPPKEDVAQLPDFRTPGSHSRGAISLELRETIGAARARQQWYCDYLLEQDANPLGFVGSFTTRDDTMAAAAAMRRRFRFEIRDRLELENNSRDDYRNALIDRFEEQGILVSIEGYVGSHTKRSLSSTEFRGFVLSDPMAPLILVNGRDWPAAQLFTLAHECAHLLLGQDALTDADLMEIPHQVAYSQVENWCNRVAAEFLLPLDELPESLTEVELASQIRALRKRFKVSTLVILHRLVDKGLLSASLFQQAYRAQVSIYQGWADQQTGGGSVHQTRLKKVGRRFATAVVESAGRDGMTYPEAYGLLGVKNDKGFDELRMRLQST